MMHTVTGPQHTYSVDCAASKGTRLHHIASKHLLQGLLQPRLDHPQSFICPQQSKLHVIHKTSSLSSVHNNQNCMLFTKHPQSFICSQQSKQHVIHKTSTVFQLSTTIKNCILFTNLSQSFICSQQSNLDTCYCYSHNAKPVLSISYTASCHTHDILQWSCVVTTHLVNFTQVSNIR